MPGDVALSASNTTQNCVTLSVNEREYVLDFVRLHLSGCAIVMCEDSGGAKALAEKPQGSHSSKHTNVRFHFLGGLVRL